MLGKICIQVKINSCDWFSLSGDGFIPGPGLKTALALERQDFWFLVLNKVLVPFQASDLTLLEQEQVYSLLRVI